MKIAFISYEYPPDTAFGGIATYMYQAAKALHLRGHTAEVFCAAENSPAGTQISPEGITVHRVACSNRKHFKDAVLPVFAARHELVRFQLAESPEYNADALRIKQQYPELPLLVKFHTPSFFVRELNRSYRKRKLKDAIKRLLHIKQYNKHKDEEYTITQLANGLCAPSAAMQQVISSRWAVPEAAIRVIPNPFLPGPALLSIETETEHNRVCFIGRLEVRKGIVTLVNAIPEVLQQCPQLKFCFIGKSDPAPNGKGQMKDFILKELAAYAAQLEFIERVEPAAIPERLQQADICVFPSLWEAAGYVCLEAMSAARAVVAGNEGGMKDMLETGNCGILIGPHNSHELAAAIVKLAGQAGLRKIMGMEARKRVLDYYAGEVVSIYELYCKQTAGIL